ncbi:hypothetical protein [Priestia abyssalis]|uniref:hypothetical protein n=1 Tax=Priestia abyssalis TaxID=1221450 RepID=UPI000995851D|nr:hypothetical protein [Priestia abyssalis]
MPRMKEVWTPLKWFGIRYFKDSENKVYYKKIGKNHRRETRPFWRYKRFGLAASLLLLLIPGFMGYEVVMDKASEKLVNEVAGQVTKEEINELLKDPTVQEMMEKELGTKKAAELLKDHEVEASGIATSGISDDDLTFKQTGTSPQTEGQEPADSSSAAITGKKDSSASVSANTDEKPSSVKEEQNQSANASEKSSSGKEQTSESDNSERPMFESRAEATKFVMSKFSMSEMSSFAQMAQGGLTSEEKTEIKSIVQSRLSAEEYEALKIFGLIELSKQ